MKAIITGATKGIGQAIATKLAAAGFDLAICARTASDLESIKNTLEQRYKVKVLTQVTNLTDKQAVKAFVQNIKNEWQTVDILVNNAGVLIPCDLSKEDDEAAFETMMDLNLYSTYYMTQGIMPMMLAQKKGHVFNICSVASTMPYGAYAISKHAMLGFSKVLREEVKEQGIRVTAMLPGITLTASWDGTTLPKERFVDAEDIAQSLFDIYQLSDRTVVEEIVLRPQLGDL